MKLIIQIPCFDEADHLPATLADLPRTLDGFDVVEYLVVDDGSSDDTVAVARRHGVHHIVRHSSNRGLAAAYMTGIASCLALGADVIVGTDGDNQYVGDDIPALVAPVRDGLADFAIGVRPINDRSYFPLWKSILTRIGTVLARLLSGLPVLDAPSGLRAYNAATARSLRVTGHFSYTMETLVQAGSRKWRMASVPIRVNPVVRRSRLMASVPQYIRKSTFALLRGATLHRPILMIGLIISAGLAAPAVAIAVNAMRYGAFALSPSAMTFGAIVCLIGGAWMWRLRRTARVREDSKNDPPNSLDALVRPDPHRGDDFAGIAGDQKKPLSDVRPVSGICMPHAMPAGEHIADG
jgi:hypothetical protein